MKSKVVILSLLLTGAAISASAQTKEKFYTERAKDNICLLYTSDAADEL